MLLAKLSEALYGEDGGVASRTETIIDADMRSGQSSLSIRELPNIICAIFAIHILHGRLNAQS
jgi:hypothetical protein